MNAKRRRNLYIWAGFAVVLLGFLSYLPFFALFAVTRDVPWANFLLFLVGGALLGVGLVRAYRSPRVYRGKISGIVLGALALLMVGLFIVGVTVLTKVPTGPAALKAGDSAPAFALSDAKGTQVSLSNLLQGRRAALLIFYRGYW